jgi:protease II
MEPQQNKVESIIYPLKQVTPLSKYLAMIIFIVMPFVGGWIGYHFAPEKIVEVEKILPADNLEEENVFPAITDLQKIFSEQISDKYEIELLYTTKKKDVQYFKSFIQGSSACCNIYKYLPETQMFHNTGIRIDMIIGEKESSTGRYVAKVVDGVSLEVYDLETQSIESKTLVLSEETLVSSTCGYAGDSHDLKWLDETTLQYGVYKRSENGENCPEMELLEQRTLKME